VAGVFGLWQLKRRSQRPSGRHGRYSVARHAAAASEETEAGEPKDAPEKDDKQTVSARIPAAVKKKKLAKNTEEFDPSKQLGVTEPLGFFDPLGFAPPNDRLKFRKLRTSELKHGRIAMLASVGLVGQHYIRFPGGYFEDVPNGVGAVLTSQGGVGLFVLTWVSLVFEFVIWAQDPKKEIGDFGDPFNVGLADDEMRNRELNNGRAAMFATVGIIVAELVSGKDGMEQLGL